MQQLMRGAQTAATRAAQAGRGVEHAGINLVARRIDQKKRDNARQRKSGHHKAPRSRTRMRVQPRRRRNRGGVQETTII